MEIINDFMHMLKHDWEITLPKIFEKQIKNSQEWCPFIHNDEKKTDFECYERNLCVHNAINFLENLYLLIDYLELDERVLKHLGEDIQKLKLPHKNKDWYTFKFNTENIQDFLKDISPRVCEKIKKFTCLECERVWESIRCFNFQSYHASTILIVSGLESRLHTLIKGKNATLYKKEIKNFTFGRILGLRDPESFKDIKFQKIKRIITNLIQEKHMPLMKLLNYYRIVSAHPSLENINKNVAKSIITLSFSFLLDEKLKIPDKLCDEEGHAPGE